MNYYHLKSIIAAGKTAFQMRKSSESFYVAEKPQRHYIEPTFLKVEFNTERPTVMLVSAVGATGKSTLAHILSNETSLPLLDLGKHKPVGDNTLTGLLTNSFDVTDLSNIFQGIRDGSYGVIIDGIDEGRSKTTEKAFEAFLDDIARLCVSPVNTCFVLIGRTQTLEDCWIYLDYKGIDTALVTISPFSLDSARKYIDTFTDALDSKFVTHYREARDYILDKLHSAFESEGKKSSEYFLSFIGYPPVLDAIVTLLQEEQNYHKLLGEIKRPDSSDVEITLLHRIASYILQREKDQKVIPNILEPLVAAMPRNVQEDTIQAAFGVEEQCIRLVSYCLKKPLSLKRIKEPPINEKYEAQLLTFLPEHPFIKGHQFRNAVFESLALATLVSSDDPEYVDLILEYVSSHKYSYHFIYLLHSIARDRYVPLRYMHVVLGSALEFRSTQAFVELNVDCPKTDDVVDDTGSANLVQIEIEILLGKSRDRSKTFDFNSRIVDNSSIYLGHRLAAAYITVPTDVSLSGDTELEITAPVEISADRIDLHSKELILKRCSRGTSDNHVILNARGIESTLENIVTNGVGLTLSLPELSGLTYPAIQYAQTKEPLPADPLLRQKYLLLRRILMHFRSHRRGALAKYKHKIEHQRVLHSDTGYAILKQLLKDEILTLSGSFYFLNPEGIDKHLGISWLDLRKGHTCDTLVQYLKSIT